MSNVAVEHWQEPEAPEYHHHTGMHPGVESEEDEDEEEEMDRMALDEDERNLAIMVKQAIEDDPELEPISDFMCAQLALIDGDDTESSLERVRHLQYFRQEYGVLDTAEDGRRCMAQYLELFPELHLHFGHHEDTGANVIVYDNTKIDSPNFTSSERNTRVWLGGAYYSCSMFCQDFEAIRSGCVIVAECEGYNWKLGVDIKALRRMWSEVCTVYPASWRKVKYFNSGTTVNIIASLLKPFLPKKLRSRFEFGCQGPQRLDKIYLVPNVEEANLRFLKKVEDALRTRYENEKTFKL